MAFQAHPRLFEEVVGREFFHGSAEELAGATDCQGILAGWILVAASLVFFQLDSNKDYSKGSNAVFVCHL